MSRLYEIDAILEEIAFHKSEALKWNKRAVEERERYDRLRDAAEAAHANVQACLDPKIDGKLGLIANAESVLRHALKEAS